MAVLQSHRTKPRRSGTQRSAAARSRAERSKPERSTAGRLTELLARPRYEVFPLDGVGDRIVDLMPPDATVTVTASPRRGMEPTLALAERLAGNGFGVVPHLSARLIADEVELKDVLDRLDGLGITEAFVVGGDPERPVGEFSSAAQLLVAMAEVGHGLTEIGVAGYPEGHPQIDDDVTIQAMWDKRQFATYVVSQICFDAGTIAEWIGRLRRRGIDLPVYVGMPGPIAADRLLRISRRIGVSESVRFLNAHGVGLLRLGKPGRYTPDRLLGRMLERAGSDVAGLHIYTFNEIESCEQWRRSKLG